MTPILCIGEVLGDALPAGLFLGGAPFNVACHLNQLGEEVSVVSRVGEDALGYEALRRMQARGIDDTHVQRDLTHRTGFVEVALDATGTPDYTIIEPVAWDRMEYTRVLADHAATARAVVFGSLAQRWSPSRETIPALWAADVPAVFDVNLRPPFVERAIVERSLQAATIVKMNDEELAQMTTWFGLQDAPQRAIEALSDRFDIATICVTRGAHGAVLWNEGAWAEHPGYAVDVADTVGAGDAFLAGLLAAYFAGEDDAGLLDAAARLGAFVAMQMGPTPRYEGLNALPPLKRNTNAGRWVSQASSGATTT
jgi:fructokinase